MISLSAQNGVPGLVAMITGAAGGLGRETALLLVRSGLRVAITDIDEAGLQETARLLAAENVGAAVVQAGDIAEPATSIALVAAALAAYGRIDAVCNIAGMLADASIADTTVQQFERIMRVNCLGQLLAVQAALPALRQRQQASIVNVASVGALVALPHMTGYCASKSAVLGLTRSMAAELAPSIRCNVVCPGGIDSNMSRTLLERFPSEQRPELLGKLVGRQLIKRFAQAGEVARVIQFLVSDASAFMTGAVIPVDGGHTAW